MCLYFFTNRPFVPRIRSPEPKHFKTNLQIGLRACPIESLEKNIHTMRSNIFVRLCISPGGRVLLGILGGGVPPGSPNPDLISDQKMSFSTPVFRPDLYNLYPFSDLGFGQKLCHHYLDLSVNKNISNSHSVKFLI